MDTEINVCLIKYLFLKSMRKLFSLLSLAIMFFMVGCETNDVSSKGSMSFTFTNAAV